MNPANTTTRNVNQGFHAFHAKLVPGSYATGKAASHKQSITRRLEDGFGLKRLFYSGSANNGTSIAHRSDIDFFASIPGDQLKENSATSLREIKDSLMSRFPNTAVYIDSPAVVLDFGSGDWDTAEVIPARFLRTKEGKNVYGIPDGSGDWMESAPSLHNSYVVSHNDRLKKKLKKLIRFAKAWKYYRDVPISSFYLELRITKWMEDESSIIYDIDMGSIFSKLDACGLAAIRDPKGVSGLVHACSSAAKRKSRFLVWQPRRQEPRRLATQRSPPIRRRPFIGGTSCLQTAFPPTGIKMNIAEKQSTERSVRYLKAQRQLYSGAKGWWAADFVFTVALTVVISVVRVCLADADLSVLAGCWAIAATFLSFFLTAPCYKRQQAKAASIQETFDSEVFGLPANPMIVAIPEDEVIDLAARHDRKGKGAGDLEDWYPLVLDRLPQPIATAICQRINSRWDEKLRGRYLWLLSGLTGAFVALVVTTGLVLDMSLKGVILSTFLPLLPGLKFLLVQIQENRATIRRLCSLAGHSQGRFQSLVEGVDPSLTARDVQNEIYLHRKSAALIPDRFFRWSRPAEEQSMKAYAVSLVESYNERAPVGDSGAKGVK